MHDPRSGFCSTKVTNASHGLNHWAGVESSL